MTEGLPEMYVEGEKIWEDVRRERIWRDVSWNVSLEDWCAEGGVLWSIVCEAEDLE